MKYWPIVWAGVTGDSARTAYTALSIFVAFILFGLLQGVASAFNGAVADAHLNRLYVDSRFGLAKGLPLAYADKIGRLPGVMRVTHATWFGASYQDARQPIFALAVDVIPYLAIYDELRLPAAQREAMAATRDGALVNRKIADRYGWKVGDRVPLKSSVWLRKNGDSTWTFEIEGIFDVADDRRTLSEIFINYAYFDEARLYKNGTVGWYIAQISDPGASEPVASAIDTRFANSADETLTQNEQDKAASLLKRHGDMSFAVRLIIGAVFFTILLLTGNTMMQSVRERSTEFAVLKTFGFPLLLIAALVVIEAMVICIGSASAGLVVAYAMYPIMQGLTDAPRMPLVVPMAGLGMALLLALVTSLPSAVRLRYVRVVDALSGR